MDQNTDQKQDQMKIQTYGCNEPLYLHATPFGLLLTRAENITAASDELLRRTAENGQAVNQQHRQRLLMSNGRIVHVMTPPLPVLECRQAETPIGEMIVLCDQQFFPHSQSWLVNAASLTVLKQGTAPEFFGYPHLNGGLEPAVFCIRYLDGSKKSYRQTVHNLPEDVEVTTEELEERSAA
jgi:hypothetical protein